MDRSAHDPRLWRSVQPVLSARKDEKGRTEGLGTGFCCGREGDTSYLLTCCHVVDTIGEDHLRVRGREVRVVGRGDKALDLALLAVDGLEDPEPLALSTGGHADAPFRTIGCFWADEKARDVPDSRPADGRLGEERRKFSDTHGPIPGWELRIAVGDEVFDRIRAGYSGAPVLDPRTGLVVAVISHQVGEERGHAIAVTNLCRLYQDAERFFDDSNADEGGGGDPWIVKTLDHLEQAGPLRERLRAGGEPVLATVEASIEDLPRFLADDVYLDPWPGIDAVPQQATALVPTRYGDDEAAFWRALHHCLPACQQSATGRERDAALAWLRSHDRHLFYVSIGIERDGGRLPA